MSEFAAAVAAAIADGHNPDEIAVIGAVFIQPGDTFATISIQKNLCSDKKTS